MGIIWIDLYSNKKRETGSKIADGSNNGRERRGGERERPKTHTFFIILNAYT